MAETGTKGKRDARCGRYGNRRGLEREQGQAEEVAEGLKLRPGVVEKAASGHCDTERRRATRLKSFFISCLSVFVKMLRVLELESDWSRFVYCSWSEEVEKIQESKGKRKKNKKTKKKKDMQ